MSRWLAVIGLLSLFSQPCFAQQWEWLVISDFKGLIQSVPMNKADPGFCVYGRNFATDANGAIIRGRGGRYLTVPTGFGTISNPTIFTTIDPAAEDTNRIVFLMANVTAPTTGAMGHHLLAASLQDTGTADGVTIASDITWHQVDDPDDLSVTSFSAAYSVAKSKGLAFVPLSKGILVIGGQTDSSGTLDGVYSDPVRCEWLGTPPIPVAVEGAAGVLNGNYQWKVTFVNGLGESHPSKPSVRVLITNKKGDVTIPIGSTGTVARRIYRTQAPTITISDTNFEYTTGTQWSVSGAGATTKQVEDYDGVIDGFETVWTKYGDVDHVYRVTSPRTQGTYSNNVEAEFLASTWGISKNITLDLADMDWVKLDWRHDYHVTNNWNWRFKWSDDSTNTVACYRGSDDVWHTYTVNRADFTMATLKNILLWNPSNTHSGSDAWWDNLRGYADVARGNYAVRLNRVSALAAVEQAVDITAIQGETITVSVYCKGFNANGARLVLDPDAGATVNSGYHTGGGDWEQLSVTLVVDGAATTMDVQCTNNVDSSYVYFDEMEYAMGTSTPGGYYYVAEVTNNTATVYYDNTADTSLATPEDVTDRSYVPAGQWITYHNERLFTIGRCPETTQSEKLWYSDDGDYNAWGSTQYVEVGKNDGDPATGLASFQGVLYIFKRNSIWRFRGVDSSDFALEKVLSNIGCEDGRTIASSDQSIYFMGKGTIYAFDGFRARDIGVALNYGVIDEIYIDSDINDFQASAAFWDSRYFLAYKNVGGAKNAVGILVWNQITESWGLMNHGYSPTILMALPTLKSRLLTLSPGAEIWDMSQSYKKETNDCRHDLVWTTPNLDLGNIFRKKELHSIWVAVDSSYGTTGIAYTLDVMKDATDNDLRLGSAPVSSTSTFALTEGWNILKWYASKSEVGRDYRTIAVKLSEGATRDTTVPYTETPPRVTHIGVKYKTKGEPR